MSNKTQEALKMAIEALQRLDLWLSERHMNGLMPREIEAINACKEALEQQAQEPVAWISESTLKHSAEYRNRFDDAKSWAEIRAVDRKTTNCDVPLYTHPHQWQGLTDDEIDAIIKEKDGVFGAVVRAIEAKLKEKNHGSS